MRRKSLLVGISGTLGLVAIVVWWTQRPETVNVVGRRVEVKVAGTGSPAVVFESDFTGERILWLRAQFRAARMTRTLTYLRAGIGRSAPGPEPRSAEQIARELHALLATLQIAPPYVLVGHSAGGLYVRVFAHLYPQEIAGLILVDPATEDFYDRMRTRTPDGWSRTSEEMRKLGDTSGLLGQWRALPESLDQARGAWPLPPVPTVVLSSTKPQSRWPLETAVDVTALTNSQAQLAAKIAGSRHVVVANSDHLSILWSSVLSEQILSVVEETRHSGRVLPE
jgi:pimeloyl-ACP methyl ester carboxylesterase